MPKHPDVIPGDTDKELNDEQNIPPLLLKDQISGGVVLTYRFRTAISRNTKSSHNSHPFPKKPPKFLEIYMRLKTDCSRN